MKTQDGKKSHVGNHPECHRGEVFLINLELGLTIIVAIKTVTEGREIGKKYLVLKHISTGEWDDFKDLNLTTKRLGINSYRNGKKIQGQRPVFIQEWEYDQKIKDPKFLEILLKFKPNHYEQD